MPGASAFFEPMKTTLPPSALRAQHACRLARDEEVAAGEDVVVAVPELERRLLDRRARRDPRVRDDDVDAAEREHAVSVGGDDGHLVGDIGSNADRDIAEVSGQPEHAFLVEIRRDDAGAFGGERSRDRAADPAGGAGDERDASLELARGRRERQLVELERPVLDGE